LASGQYVIHSSHTVSKVTGNWVWSLINTPLLSLGHTLTIEAETERDDSFSIAFCTILLNMNTFQSTIRTE